MTQDLGSVEDGVRQRIRALRAERGWSLDDLGARTHLSASTLSRLETGGRRIALDHVITLARALEVDVAVLFGTVDEPDEVIIRPQRNRQQGITSWLLTRHGDPSGRVVAKMRYPARRGPLEAQVHPGRDWFLVLDGIARLVLGGREHLVREGEAAEFSTLTPHAIAGYGGAVEVLTIFDQHGAASHLPGRRASS